MTTLLELHKILDAIEEEEAKLLTWGDTGGKFSEEEVLTLIEKIISHEDPDDVLDELVERAMILPVMNASGMIQGYRSRMGETVHLYRNLRQWFHGKMIEQSNTLVSDYRFLRRKRQYPKRDLQLSELFELWSTSLSLSQTIKTSITQLVGEYSLSGFQSRATERILKAIPQHKRYVKNSTATIICAGTGSGKTMAFYLPALSAIVDDLRSTAEHRVRTLAIYPRKELLKDQFNETWSQCRKLDSLVLGFSGRKIIIGALFGDTPNDAKTLSYNLKQYRPYHAFGLLKCANDDCDGEMRWHKEDIDKNIERLKCSLCSHQVEGDEVILTRKSMVKTPPDILFTTTEMLNQQMGNPYRQKLFGIKTNKPIPLVLLDEVHTYSGIQGSQTAYLLRRWKKLSHSSPHFVGLSATLSDAENYFARLTGTNSSRVALVEPLANEMIEEGAEYLLALRGDPVAQTALLSTTIQASMLARRLQDTHREKISQGTWGSKTFIFTDDLDIKNRLFTNLADAEGLVQKKNQLVPKVDGLPLAVLRNPSSSNTSREKLLQYGQDWSAAKVIGFALDANDRSKISKTSSQDSGVDLQSELVVATASLEVGFNDPNVGVVIQHKSPRNVASYLQRKGRAGRHRVMRPWMVIILSDYGRDRSTYQYYERLLDPEITLPSLPLENGHIQRMQASMATMDWLGLQVEGFNPWLDFNRPQKLGAKKNHLLEILTNILDGGFQQIGLTQYLLDALQINNQELNKILWQPPRSIFMELIPSIKQYLELNWANWSFNTQSLQEWANVNPQWGSPMPKFIPDNLFSDLNLPVLNISLHRGLENMWEGMSFFQGLRAFSPGRISKRFSTHIGTLSDWLVPTDFIPNLDQDAETINFEIEQAFGESLTLVDEINFSEKEKLAIYKPYHIYTSSTSKLPFITDSTYASLNWHSIFKPSLESELISLPKGSLWRNNFLSINFYTHRTLTQLELIRFNTGSNAELKFRGGESAKVCFNWKKNNQQVGIGAKMWVDAAKLEFKISNDEITQWLENDALLRVLRSSYLQDKLRLAEMFEGNHFQADWVYECLIAAIIIEVIHADCDISEAITHVYKNNSIFPLTKIPEILFQQDFNVVDENIPSEALDKLETKDQKLQEELKILLSNTTILSELHSITTILTEPIEHTEEFLSWCRNIVGNTLASAIQQSICTLFPDVDEREVIADTEFKEDILRIWLCEQDSGGTGVIEQLNSSYAEDPLKILNIFAHTLQESDYEQLDYDLQSLLLQSQSGNDIQQIFKNVRDAASYDQRLSANKKLKHRLTEQGFQYSHSFASVIHSRILRPGSSSSSDKTLLSYLQRWTEVEVKLGLELPMNIIALVLSMDKNSDKASPTIFSDSCKIQSVLWPRGASVRQASLNYYNQFNLNNNRTERLLVAPLCADTTQLVLYSDDDWLINTHKILASNGKVNLQLNREKIKDITNIFATLNVTPIDTQGLLFYPRTSSIKHHMNHILICLELAEAIQ